MTGWICLSLLAGMLMLTGCEQTRRVPRVLEKRQTPIRTTPTQTTKTEKAPKTAPVDATAKPADPKTTNADKPADKLSNKVAPTQASAADDSHEKDLPDKDSRNKDLPKEFLVAADIHRADPFIPPSTALPNDAVAVSTANKPADLFSLFNPAKPSVKEEPDKPKTAVSSVPVPLPPIKIPQVSVKGIVTGVKNAMALLSDDEGRTQTVKPGELTYLTQFPSRVVAITAQQVVLEAQEPGGGKRGVKRQYLSVPSIVGFRASSSSNTATSSNTDSSPRVSGAMAAPPSLAAKPTPKPVYAAKGGSGVVTSTSGIIVLPNRGNAPSAGAPDQQPLTLSSPEAPTLNVEKVSP